LDSILDEIVFLSNLIYFSIEFQITTVHFPAQQKKVETPSDFESRVKRSVSFSIQLLH